MRWSLLLIQSLPERATFEGLPVVPFEEVEEHYPPSDYALFIPMTASKMNHNRRLLYETGKAKGYQFISYISSKATVLTDRIGKLLHLGRQHHPTVRHDR